MKYFYVFLGMIFANIVSLFLFSSMTDTRDDCEHSPYDVREECYPEKDIFISENFLREEGNK